VVIIAALSIRGTNQWFEGERVMAKKNGQLTKVRILIYPNSTEIGVQQGKFKKTKKKPSDQMVILRNRLILEEVAPCSQMETGNVPSYLVNGSDRTCLEKMPN